MKHGEQEVDVLRVPGARLAVDDLLDFVASVYFATSIARDSRITITFTWPGYSS